MEFWVETLQKPFYVFFRGTFMGPLSGVSHLQALHLQYPKYLVLLRNNTRLYPKSWNKQLTAVTSTVTPRYYLSHKKRQQSINE